MTEDEAEQRAVRDFFGGATGAFVEVGAHSARDGSQTYHLEEIGWRGILIEPQSRLIAKLGKERPNAFVVRAACTSPDRCGTVTLFLPSETGFATLEPNKDDFHVVYPEREEVPARTLDGIIEEWRSATGSSAPIKFLSIDVEGHEESVLRGFTASRHRPELILVEDKLQDLSKHRLLVGLGYRLVRRTCLNNWYVSKSVTPPKTSLLEKVRLIRKVFLGLPFRMFRRWRYRRRSFAPKSSS